MGTSIQLKRGTSSRWASTNPVLHAGEVGIEKDSGWGKAGDGTTPWNDLPYSFTANAKSLVYSAETNLAVHPSSIYRWNISASNSVLSLAANALPKANSACEIYIYFNIQDTGGVSAGTGVTFADVPGDSGWYVLRAQNENGTVTASLYSCKGSGGASVNIKMGPCSGLAIVFGQGNIQMQWTDPEDVTLNDTVIAYWSKTVLVRKEEGFPSSPDDGVIVATTSLAMANKSAYSQTPFVDSNIEDGHIYYYKLFSYSTSGAVNSLTANEYPTSTAMSMSMIHAFSQAGTLLNYMSIGDCIVINHPEFDPSDGYSGQLVQLVGYDCVTPNSGTGHAAVFQFVDLLFNATKSYGTMSFDPAETQYELTDDTVAIAGKTYYTLSGSTYTALVEGTDWTAGQDVPLNSWYEKNPNTNYNVGTNKWDESNLRQYLNAELPANTWWHKMNLWDVGAYKSRNGFLYNFPNKELLVPIKRTVARSTSYGGGSVTCVDKIFLPSMYELMGTKINNIAEGVRRWDYYNTYTDASYRIKFLNGTATNWWLASPAAAYPSYGCSVGTSGATPDNSSRGACGVAPVFAL